MTDQLPITTAQFMRDLGITLEMRPSVAGTASDALDAWDCRLTRTDGRTYELAAVTFMVYEEEGDWEVEPTPSAVIDLLRFVDEGPAGADAGNVDQPDEALDPEREEREALGRFLGPEGLALLGRLSGDESGDDSLGDD